MRQAVWTGAISFGLVSIPVKLYPATEPKDVRFHLYDRLSGKRVRYERVTREDEGPAFAPGIPTFDDSPGSDGDVDDSAPIDEAPERGDVGPSDRAVHAADVVRGFEMPTGDLVTVSEDDLVTLAPERSREIAIEEFVDLAQIDPVFFEKSYHVAPGRGAGAEKPYALLHEAMRAAHMVAIGRFVLRTRPHLVAIRPLERTLALETLFFGDEVRSPEEAIGPLPHVAVSERELTMARQLVRALATDWVPEKHADTYRQELLALLERKSPSTPPDISEETAASPASDLMARLVASVEAAKRKASAAPKRPARYDVRTRRSG
jgi:DNA end-binding protein Ku